MLEILEHLSWSTVVDRQDNADLTMDLHITFRVVCDARHPPHGGVARHLSRRGSASRLPRT
jgi:hypothetical protein